LLKACEDSKSCFALLDSPEVVSGGVDTLILPRASQWGVFLYPWVQVQDPEKGNVYVPPSGLVAGVYVRTERQSGQPPTNETVTGALGVRYAVSRKEQAEAAAKRINLIQLASGAIRLSSVYTIEPNPTAISSAGLEKMLEDNCLDTLGQIAGLVDKTRESLDEPQVFVWYPERRDAYQGYVMFTWPIAQLGGCITTPEAHLTIGIEMTVMRPQTAVITRVPGGVDTTRGGVAAPPAAGAQAVADAAAAVHAVTVSPGVFAAEMVPAHSKLNEKLVVFRDSEWAGPIQILEDFNLGQAVPDGLDEVLRNLATNTSRSIILTSLRISIDPAVCDLGIKYAGRDLRGKVLEARGEVDGKWLRSAKGFSSLRIGLTGADKDRYDVRYMARFRLLRFALETSWCENYEEVSVASIPPAQLGGLLTVVERIGPILPIEALYVKVIPKGTPAPSLSRFAARWTNERPSITGIIKKEG
jgi:hypothetical protein